MLKRLFQNLQEEFGYSFEDKGLNIFCVKIGEFELEFSSPRIEEFIEEDHSHKNFTPRFISNLPHREAFARRDFTLNSIGVFFGVSGADDEFKIVDPYGGVEDLDKGILRSLNDDFYKDPVRFLRAIRFKNKYQLQISDKTLSGFEHFNLESLSNYYLLSEFKKCESLNYFKDIFEYSSRYSLVLPEKFQNLSFLSNICDHSIANIEEDFSLWLGLHLDIDANQKNLAFEYFGLSTKLCRKLIQIVQDYKSLDKNNMSSFARFFEGLFSVEFSKEDTLGWSKYKQLWVDGLKNFKPDTKSLAKQQRIELKEYLSERIVAAKNS